MDTPFFTNRSPPLPSSQKGQMYDHRRIHGEVIRSPIDNVKGLASHLGVQHVNAVKVYQNAPHKHYKIILDPRVDGEEGREILSHTPLLCAVLPIQ